MTWIEDDSQGISEEIKNMSQEERLAIIAAYEAEAKKRNLARQQAKPVSF
ncbi:MAG: hypothetical protein LBL98_02060 [Ruminococcus sp.]|jgi:hypothetical protein|nr:hypothetical protein [Ruminococcus sp.]